MKKIKCPRCHEMTTWENNPFRPFCGKSCKERDLGSWASEEYRIPVHSDERGAGEVEGKKNGGQDGDEDDN